MEEDTNNSRAHLTCLAMFQFDHANYITTNKQVTTTPNVVFLEGVVINLRFLCGLMEWLSICAFMVFSTSWTFNFESSNPLNACLLVLSVSTIIRSIATQQSFPFEDPLHPLHLYRLRHISVGTYIHFCNYTSYIWSSNEFVSFFVQMCKDCDG